MDDGRLDVPDDLVEINDHIGPYNIVNIVNDSQINMEDCFANVKQIYTP